MSCVPLFRIDLSFFTISFQLNNYLTVYYDKRIKTVKSIKTIKYKCEFELHVSFFKFQSHILTQTIFEMTRFKISCGTYDPLWQISRLNTVISHAWMGSESIAHEAKGRMGYWLRGHVGERNNCFSKIQQVGQKNLLRQNVFC